MPDERLPLLGHVARLDRRRLIGAVTSGALLGSAWAASFRDAVLADDDTHVTVARTDTAFGALIEHRGHRIMLIDAGDAPAANMVTELTTGFLRRRIDAVLLPASAVDTLPSDYAERWRVRDLWTLPDQPDPTATSIAGKALHIGELAIETDALPMQAWRAGTPTGSAWYVSARIGRARLVVTSDGDALERLPLDARDVNAVICFDPDLEVDRIALDIDLLAVPTETVDRVPAGPRTVALSRDETVAFRLCDNRVEMP